MILSQDDDVDGDDDNGETTSVNVPSEFSAIRWKRCGNNGEHMKIYRTACAPYV